MAIDAESKDHYVVCIITTIAAYDSNFVGCCTDPITRIPNHYLALCDSEHTAVDTLKEKVKRRESARHDTFFY